MLSTLIEILFELERQSDAAMTAAEKRSEQGIATDEAIASIDRALGKSDAYRDAMRIVNQHIAAAIMGRERGPVETDLRNQRTD